MVGLTFTPPLVPAIKPRSFGGAENAQFVLAILSGAALGAVGDSLADTLALATGPGNIVTGTVIKATPGGDFTLTTSTGAELTLHHPPELPIAIGSLVTLRIATTAGPTPQATILSVDGKPLLQPNQPGPQPPAAQPPPPRPASAQPPPAAAAQAPPPQGQPLPGSGNASAYAASLAALLEFEEPPEDAASLVDEPSTTTTAPASASATELLPATLVKPAAAAYGQQSVALGTRYLLTLTEGDVDDPTVEATEVDPDLASDYTAQEAAVGGRVMPSPRFDQLLVDTPMGTLAVATGKTLGVGTPVRLGIGAVAPPLALPDAAAPTPADGLIDQIIAMLTAASSSAVAAAELLVMQPNENLLAKATKFLADAKSRALGKTSLGDVRRLLIEADRSDLADRLQAVTRNFGEARPEKLADGWAVTILPFLGQIAEEPVRLYVRDDGGEHDKQQREGHGRIVVEVNLRRLGPMQFEVLTREKRLDLVVRTAAPLETGLVGTIETAFHDAVEACGYAGDIGFGKIMRFPIALPDTEPHAVALEA